MKIGIVGLPNVGKSTLFNAITKSGAAEAANYPFCTIEPNIGVATVPDSRIDKLAEMFFPDKITHAIIEFVDIAGLVKGASKGEGLGNKFLSHIREVDAIAHVVRCFDDPNVVHVEGSADPLRDIETIRLELIFADLETIGKIIDKNEKMLKADKKYQFNLDVAGKIKTALEAGNDARSLDLSDKELAVIKDFNLLTLKPVIYVANVSEEDIGSPASVGARQGSTVGDAALGVPSSKNSQNPRQSASSAFNNKYVDDLSQFAHSQNAETVIISARIEEELAALDGAEKAEFLAELGIEKSGLDQMISAGYSLLGLISYLTAGKPEVRAWTIPEGTKAPAAAGKIHTDFE
ncbi:MAG: redox-regulated ATPase YchF, partial [Oscillospiraceae bacterium]|nr:redox-regulated ATPase YchF [Oscillospiraceae bacterium]